MNKILTSISIVLLCCIANALPAWAQEAQVNICAHTAINADLAQKLDLFKKYKDCLQVTMFQNSSTNEKELEVLYKPEKIILKERIKISEAEINNLCAEIARIEAPTMPNISGNATNRNGRGSLVAASMLLSLGYYGWATPLALNAEGDEKAYVASYMLIGSASFFAPFLLTRNKPVSAGMARAYVAGGALGIGHGWLTTLLIQGDDIESKTGLGVSVATSLGESMLALAVAQKYNLDVQNVGWISTGSIWGAAAGAGITHLTGAKDPRTYAFTALVGTGGGMLAGHYAYKKLPVPQGDLFVVNEYGVLGAYLPVPIVNSIVGDDYNMSDEDKLKRYTIGSLAGAAVGLTAGFYRTKNYDYSLAQGAWMQLGELSGGLLGLGTAYLLSNNNSDETPYLWSVGMGATAGLLFTDWIVRSAANKDGGNTGMGRKKDNSRTASWHFDLNPIGVAQSLQTPPLPNKPQHNPTQALNNYALKVALRF